MDDDRNQIRKKSALAEGGLNYHLILFGDRIAEREGYVGLDGLEAVHYYLIHKFHWLPRDVFAMKLEDIRFVLDQELSNPAPAQGPSKRT